MILHFFQSEIIVLLSSFRLHVVFSSSIHLSVGLAWWSNRPQRWQPHQQTSTARQSSTSEILIVENCGWSWFSICFPLTEEALDHWPGYTNSCRVSKILNYCTLFSDACEGMRRNWVGSAAHPLRVASKGMGRGGTTVIGKLRFLMKAGRRRQKG